MLDVNNGQLTLAAGVVIDAASVADPQVLKVFKDDGEVNGLRLFSAPSERLWERNFTVNLRFEGGRLHFVELIWNDGPVNRLGYDASETDLLGEKRQLVNMLSKQLGLAPAGTSLGVDYFPFAWGLVSARADLKSTLCSVVIDYFYKAG